MVSLPFSFVFFLCIEPLTQIDWNAKTIHFLILCTYEEHLDTKKWRALAERTEKLEKGKARPERNAVALRSNESFL